MHRTIQIALVACLAWGAPACGSDAPPTPDQHGADERQDEPPPKEPATADRPTPPSEPAGLPATPAAQDPVDALPDVPRPRPGSSRIFPDAPKTPTAPLDAEVTAALDAIIVANQSPDSWGTEELAALAKVAESEDARVAWILSDILRFAANRRRSGHLAGTTARLLDVEFDPRRPWGSITDHLMAWDLPAPPEYLEFKRKIFTPAVPEWERIFQPGDIDWRHVTWGGVGIDDRPFGKTDEPIDSIPAADDPKVADVASTTWLEDTDVVFGVVVGKEARAYPRRIMEVREMVNDTLGGRDLAIPYCTLCASAQAYLTDELPKGVQRPVLRTSGLLTRSNKVMFDVNTFSVFDTFKGHAVTGPLAEKGVKLRQVGVVTTTWGAWKKAHPHTTALVEELAMGRDFDFRSGRDANGPIFPIGDVDARLPIQDDIVGLFTESGRPVAFHVETARQVLESGGMVRVENIHLTLDGGGIRAVDTEGKDLGGHQAFWFAWSQFHPDTRLWPPASDDR